MKTEMEAMSRWDFQNEIKRNRISYLKNLHETGPNIIQLRNSRAERSYPASEATGCSQEEPPQSEVRAEAGLSHPAPKAGGGRLEEQPHVQGAVAAGAQEGLEELSHVEGQEGW